MAGTLPKIPAIPSRGTAKTGGRGATSYETTGKSHSITISDRGEVTGYSMDVHRETAAHAQTGTLDYAKHTLGNYTSRAYSSGNRAYTKYSFANGSEFTWDNRRGGVTIIPEPGAPAFRFTAGSEMNKDLFESMLLLTVDIIELRKRGVDPQKLARSMHHKGLNIDPPYLREDLEQYLRPKPIPKSAMLRGAEANIEVAAGSPTVALSQPHAGTHPNDADWIVKAYNEKTVGTGRFPSMVDGRTIRLASGMEVTYTTGNHRDNGIRMWVPELYDGETFVGLSPKGRTGAHFQYIKGELTDAQVQRFAVAVDTLRRAGKYSIHIEDIFYLKGKEGKEVNEAHPITIEEATRRLEVWSTHPLIAEVARSGLRHHPELGRIMFDHWIARDEWRFGYKNGQFIHWDKENHITVSLAPEGDSPWLDHSKAVPIATLDPGAGFLTFEKAAWTTIAVQKLHAAGADMKAVSEQVKGKGIDAMLQILEAASSARSGALDMHDVAPATRLTFADHTGEPVSGLSHTALPAKVAALG